MAGTNKVKTDFRIVAYRVERGALGVEREIEARKLAKSGNNPEVVRSARIRGCLLP